ALRRFALLVGAVGGGTVVVSIVLGLLLGASLPRAIALGYYLVGSFLLLAGFFFGNRGPVRPRGDDDHGDFFMRPRGRRVRWATRDDELSEFESLLLRAHLDGCDTCREFEASARFSTTALRAAPLEQPARPLALPTKRRQAFGLRVSSAAAAAVLVMVFGGVF